MKKTSIIANRMAEKTLKSDHYKKILRLMKDGKERNYQDIARGVRLEGVQVGRRISEMVKDGCIKASGNVSKTPTGRPAMNYVINIKN